MPSLFKCSFISLGRIALILAALQLAACNSPEERAQNYYERGMKLLAQQDYVKASLELKNALQLKKDLVEAWRALAEIEQHNQNWESLIAIRRTIVELDPKDVDEKLRLARLLVVAKMPEDALNLVNAAVELDDQSSNAQGLKWLIFLSLMTRKGLFARRRRREKDVNNVEATVVIAADEFARGDTDGMAVNRRTLVFERIGVQLFKLKIFEQMQNSKQVEAVLQKLIELYSKEIPFRRALVSITSIERPADAEKELQILAAPNPSDVEAGLDVVRYLGMTKGATAARQELLARSNARPEPSVIALLWRNSISVKARSRRVELSRTSPKALTRESGAWRRKPSSPRRISAQKSLRRLRPWSMRSLVRINAARWALGCERRCEWSKDNMMQPSPTSGRHLRSTPIDRALPAAC